MDEKGKIEIERSRGESKKIEFIEVSSRAKGIQCDRVTILIDKQNSIIGLIEFPSTKVSKKKAELLKMGHREENGKVSVKERR